MICQRTGYCCINMWVTVVVPDEDGKLGVYGKPADVQCPNLKYDDKGSASCAVHEESWFEHTPCHRYQNSNIDPDFILKRGKKCMLGPMARERLDLVQLGTRPALKELEFFGDFEEGRWG